MAWRLQLNNEFRMWEPWSARAQPEGALTHTWLGGTDLCPLECGTTSGFSHDHDPVQGAKGCMQPGDSAVRAFVHSAVFLLPKSSFKRAREIELNPERKEDRREE